MLLLSSPHQEWNAKIVKGEVCPSAGTQTNQDVFPQEPKFLTRPIDLRMSSHLVLLVFLELSNHHNPFPNMFFQARHTVNFPEFLSKPAWHSKLSLSGSHNHNQGIVQIASKQLQQLPNKFAASCGLEEDARLIRDHLGVGFSPHHSAK